jgi:hypothetical protein
MYTRPMIVSIVVCLILAGLALWAISQFPLDPIIVRIIRVVIVVAVVLWLLRALGLWHGALP